jgi:putative protease
LFIVRLHQNAILIRGTSTNTYRWKYDAHPAEENETGDIVAIQRPDPTLGEGKPPDQMFLLQEHGHPNEHMPELEDKHETYIIKYKYLSAIQHVECLLNIGVQSLKIEGRTKRFDYCACTAKVF